MTPREPVPGEGRPSLQSLGLGLTGTLRADAGMVAQFDCSLSLERREWYELAGTEGSLLVPAAFLPGTEDTMLHERHGRREATDHVVAGADEYRLMVEHFADVVLGRESLRYPATEAARNMDVIEALYASARAGGRPVEVPRRTSG